MLRAFSLLVRVPVFFVFVTSLSLFSQITATGGFLGRVTDATGAVVPIALVRCLRRDCAWLRPPAEISEGKRPCSGRKYLTAI